MEGLPWEIDDGGDGDGDGSDGADGDGDEPGAGGGWVSSSFLFSFHREERTEQKTGQVEKMRRVGMDGEERKKPVAP